MKLLMPNIFAMNIKAMVDLGERPGGAPPPHSLPPIFPNFGNRYGKMSLEQTRYLILEPSFPELFI